MDRGGQLLFKLVFFLQVTSLVTAGIYDGPPGNLGTIIFSSFQGRQVPGWELFSLPTPSSLLGVGDHKSTSNEGASGEARHTQGNSLSYNGQFVKISESTPILNRLARQSANVTTAGGRTWGLRRALARSIISPTEAASGYGLVYTSESTDGGLGELYFGAPGGQRVKLTDELAYHDRPSVVPGEDRVIFAGTYDCLIAVRQSCTRTYSLDLRTKKTTLLTRPAWTTDYSPSVSPSGEWVAAASISSLYIPGETDVVDYKRPSAHVFLPADIVIFRSSDGSDRQVVAHLGGWPTWSGDGRTIFFHRRLGTSLNPGEWAVFSVDVSDFTLRSNSSSTIALQEPKRLSPVGTDVFSPAAAPNGKFLAVITNYPPSEARHLELLDLSSGKLTELFTGAPGVDVYNPFISPDSLRVGYHRCLCSSKDEERKVPLFQSIRSPVPGLSIIRCSKDFTAVSSDGEWIGFDILFPKAGVQVVSTRNFSERIDVFEGQQVFGLNFNPMKNTLYTSAGQWFAEPKDTVSIVAMDLPPGKGRFGQSEVTVRRLTAIAPANNGFPAVSPDGQKIVFRSGRSGYKNLYIMDADVGDDKKLGHTVRLTDGAWDDTMPSWSPRGDWIAFSSDRLYPGTFSAYLIRPNGSDLHIVFQTGNHFGRVNHLHFSPDGSMLTVACDQGGYAAEPISNPAQFQGYGNVYIMDLNGKNVKRIVYFPWESGLPTWTSLYFPTDTFTEAGDDVMC